MRWTNRNIRMAIRAERIIAIGVFFSLICFGLFKLLGWDAKIPALLLAGFSLLQVISWMLAARAAEVKTGIARQEAFGFMGALWRIALGIIVLGILLYLLFA